MKKKPPMPAAAPLNLAQVGAVAKKVKTPNTLKIKGKRNPYA